MFVHLSQWCLGAVFHSDTWPNETDLIWVFFLVNLLRNESRTNCVMCDMTVYLSLGGTCGALGKYGSDHSLIEFHRLDAACITWAWWSHSRYDHKPRMLDKNDYLFGQPCLFRPSLSALLYPLSLLLFVPSPSVLTRSNITALSGVCICNISCWSILCVLCGASEATPNWVMNE